MDNLASIQDLLPDNYEEECFHKMASIFARTILTDDSSKDYEKWFKENVISNESSISSGYDLSLRPFFRDIADSFINQPHIKNISVMASTGAGKSAFMTALSNYIVANDPGPTLITFQNESEASNFAETRLFPTFNNNPKLDGIIPAKRNGQRKKEIMFPHMMLWTCGATLGQLQSKSCRYLFGDEVFAWKDGMLREFLARHHSRWNRKILLISQGGWTNSDWANFYNNGKIMEYSWKCPKCNVYNNFLFDYLHWSKDKDLTLDELSKTVFMECPSCKHKIEDNISNRRMLVDSGKFIAKNDKPLIDHISYHINCLAIYENPWSDTVLEFLKSNKKAKDQNNKEDLHKFLQKRLANHVGFSVEDAINIDIKTNESISISGYKVQDEITRYLTVDVQKDHYWVTVWAVDNSANLWLKYFGRCDSDEEIVKLQMEWDVGSKVLLDEAYDQQTTRRICCKRKWIGVNGTKAKGYKHEDGCYRVYSPVERNIVEGIGQVATIRYSSQKCKTLFANHLNKGKVNIPYDVDKRFLEQLNAEAQFLERDRETGRNTLVWKTKKKGDNNSHAFDTSVAAFTMALFENKIFENEDDEV